MDTDTVRYASASTSAIIHMVHSDTEQFALITNLNTLNNNMDYYSVYRQSERNKSGAERY